MQLHGEWYETICPAHFVWSWIPLLSSALTYHCLFSDRKSICCVPLFWWRIMFFAFFQCQKLRRVEALWTLRVICTTIQIDSQTAMINPYGEQCLNVWVVSEDSKDDSKMEGEHCFFQHYLSMGCRTGARLALTGRLSRPGSSALFQSAVRHLRHPVAAIATVRTEIPTKSRSRVL